MRGRREIDSVEAAVVRMDNTMVKSILNSLIVKQMFQPTTELSDKKFRLFWQHSSQVAAICYADLVTVANLQSYVGEDHYLASVEWARVPAFTKLGLDTDVAIVDMDEKGDEIREVQSALLK